MKRIIVLSLVLICLSGTALCEPQRFSAVYTDSFDTVISLIAFADSQETFNEWSSAVHELYLYLHKLFDRYNTYEKDGIVSVCEVNQRAAKEPVEVDPILFALLSFSKEHYEMGQGQTNIAMGNLLGIWHEVREQALDTPSEAHLPDMDALIASSAHMNIDDLVLDPEKKTVYFADPELQLDVGAVAKGYATEIVGKMLEQSPLSSFILSAGGNVRIGKGPLDGRENWGVGIQSPDGEVFAASEIAETLYIRECSVVTSGDYQRYFDLDGTRYCHLVDPDTLMPASFYRSVSIITQDSGLADFISTAAYLMPYEESRAFIEGLDGVEAIWLFADGTELMTDGAKPYCKSQGATNPN